MKLYSINTGNFKLDGGAMFGVVPKSIWNKTNPADENNMISMAMRALLIEDGNKLILIDNGMGTKQDAKFFSYYYLHGDDTLEKSLAKHGFAPDDITDMFLSHLHFDHCGGSVNGTRTEQNLNSLLRMQLTGAMNNIGTGLHILTKEKKLVFFQKIFYL